MLAKTQYIFKKVLKFVIVAIVSFFVMIIIGGLTGLIGDEVNNAYMIATLILPIVLAILSVTMKKKPALQEKFQDHNVSSEKMNAEKQQQYEAQKEEIRKKLAEFAEQNSSDDKEYTELPNDITFAHHNTDQPYLPKVGKTHRVAGLYYREGNVLKLAKLNPNYSLTEKQIIKNGLQNTYIHKYLFPDGPTVLEQEPTNPHDPNAIKVVVAGQHIGYIKAGSCAHLNKVINEGRIERILCRISGGPYKVVFSNQDKDGKDAYDIDSGSTDLRAEIRVVEK